MCDLFDFKEKWKGEKDLKKRKLVNLVLVVVFVGAVLLIAKTANTIRQFNYIGAGIAPTNVISVSGEGEVFAVPDIAEINFSVRAEKKTIGEAQKEVTAKMNTALDFVKKSGVAEKDIKTTNYNAYPKYNYQYGNPGMMSYIPQPYKQVLVGYYVDHFVIIKIRDTDKVGTTLDGLGKLGLSDLSGPNFSIDDDQKIKADARRKAIDDAKAKAEVLASDLGVKLVRITGFSESGNYPIYYAKSMGMSAGMVESAPTPDIPKGENKITSNVTITYEIR